jgi:hypothetical protein
MPITAQSNLFGHLPDEPVPARRSRTTNNPLSRNSTATARGRRVNDLLLSILQRMADRGNDAIAAATKVAELEVDAEEVRKRRAEGKADIDEVVKAERLARHAKRELSQFGFNSQNSKQKARGAVPAFLQTAGHGR